MFSTILHVVQVLSALALIGIILIQQGKGASMGAAFGAGASATVFGARGAGSVLTRLTTILAVIFFSVSFYMSYLSAHRAEARSVVEQALQAGEGVPPTAAAEGPAAPPANGATVAAPPDDLPVLPGEAPAATTGAVPDAAPAATDGPELRALPPAEPAAPAPAGAGSTPPASP
ncbi:MAG TPA: preprotein translocase subunit SecG [Gammaproteobacteria bacterium]|nr:preprotein translocase subunit SecG [Gammaproteobacteria bacterium]